MVGSIINITLIRYIIGLLKSCRWQVVVRSETNSANNNHAWIFALELLCFDQLDFCLNKKALLASNWTTQPIVDKGWSTRAKFLGRYGSTLWDAHM